MEIYEIPQKLNKPIIVKDECVKKRRVAGYARVSTDKDEQEKSYETQVKYYTEYIQSRPEWEFAGLYSDEGISATSTRNRDGFNNMIKDALAGKIDLIITKSVSRFARNTVDSLQTVRTLKENGIEIYFEKENIWTLDAKGELLITIMSSLAQEESRSISENTTWGIRKNFENGKVSVAYSTFLGYDKGPNGEFVINEEQAEIVRMIYKMFISGLSPYNIGNRLSEMGIKSPAGKKKWQASTVRSILTNEKYKGDALAQKSYVSDFLTKKTKKNNGEIKQIYIRNHHPAIIDPLIFDEVQIEMKRRCTDRHSGVGIMSGKLKCECCGGWYGRKEYYSNVPRWRKFVYQCNSKYKKKCTTPTIPEKEIQQRFCAVAKKVLFNKEELVENAKIMMEMVCGTDELAQKRDEAENNATLARESIDDLIKENGSNVFDQQEYIIKYEDREKVYDAALNELNEIQIEIMKRRSRAEKFKRFIAALENGERFAGEFDEDLWVGLVKEVLVKKNGELVFQLNDGQEIVG